MTKSRILLLASIVVVVFYDFINIFKQLFFFVRVSDILYLLKFSFLASIEYQLLGLGVVLLIVAAYLMYTKSHLDKKNVLISINIIVVFYLIFFVALDNEDITRSNTKKYFENRDRFFFEKFYETEVPLELNEKMDSVLSLDKVKTHDKVLFVINESFGVPLNSKINEELIAPVEKLIPLTNQGIVSYSGFTIGGEMREFCKFRVVNYNIKNSNIDFSHCLINQIHALGYETTSIHGTSGFMYDRKYWYPKVGFSQQIFLDQGLDLREISMCKSFPGACDQDLAKTVIEQLNQDKKHFVYWLTLNTHNPYKLKDLKTEPFDCEHYNIVPTSATCRYLSLQKQYFLTLANIVEQYKGEHLKIILVGDHMPPLPMEQRVMFERDRVPYYIFEK
ncbi:sulfatase-like hydrolase/transferase [Acinetobacter sp. 194]|uniref:sulfatase-like hydrolase/transferase n=1 Tax=Acinetobacter shaoyimingii TaxID=2715164 RepID=UPI00140BD425|nr:sulfatase-like hydrolase/transferase [Acinetobacter shaoyimingii]NHB58089.1 sulfatase-like hydrolase/transferase [Acinetobacter shaoyimingii]